MMALWVATGASVSSRLRAIVHWLMKISGRKRCEAGMKMCAKCGQKLTTGQILQVAAYNQYNDRRRSASAAAARYP